MNLRKKIAVVALTVGMCIASISSAFSDLPQDHWAYEKVKLMEEKQIITGFEDGTFRPQETVTREQFATILTKTLELKAGESTVDFRDIEEDRWSKPYIDAASTYLTGYLNNGNYYFNPTMPAVREDMAVAVVKAKELENEVPDYTVLDKFSDKDKISNNLKKYIAIAVENGIMNGNADGTFNPTGYLTRAEITALMSNVLDKVVIGEVTEKNMPGDVNSDGYVTSKDRTVLARYLDGWEGYEEQVNKTNSDVFVDGKIDKMDYIVIGRYIAGWNIEYPHECESYTKKYENVNSEVHKEIYECDCKEVKQEEEVEHEFNYGRCMCGAVPQKEEISVKIEDTWYSTDDELQVTSWLFVNQGEEYKLETKVNGKLTSEGLKFSVEANPFGIKISDNGIITATDIGTGKGEIQSENGLKIKFNIWINEAEKVEILYGDVNSDGKVTQLDVTHLKKYLTGEKTEIDKLKADVFLDGKIDNMDVITLRSYLAGGYIEKMPHECEGYRTGYYKDGEIHSVVYFCKCGKLEYEEKQEHTFVDEQCICGAVKEEIEIIYGDVNSDGAVTNKDRTVLARFLDGWDGYEEQVNKVNADVFVDGKIDKMDYIVIGRYIAGWNVEFPHTCGSYDVSNEKLDEELHNEIYECDCGEIKDEEEVEHDFNNGKCECGAKELEINEYALEAWEDLESIGLIGDISDYDLTEAVTRAEMAEMVCRMTGVSEGIANIKKNFNSSFNDVDKGEWYTGWIIIAVENGLMEGETTSSFNPEGEMNVNEAITFIVRTLGKGEFLDKNGSWPGNYINEAKKLGITDDISDDERILSYESFVIMVHNALDAPTWDVVSTTLDGEIILEEADSLREKYFE